MRLVLYLLALSAWPLTAQAQETIAFFGLHLEDSSRETTQASALNPTKPDDEDLARVTLLEAMLVTRFSEEGYEFLDLAPVAVDLDRVANPASCYGCDVRMAKSLGADFILVGEINKVSPALVSIAVQLRDGQTGQVVKGGSVSVRGSTDAIWQRGMKQILKNRIFRETKQ